MGEILNPYIAGAPVVERSMFFGRQDVFDWIERSLAGQYVNNILVIHGQRRVGKTSVLKQIPHHLSSKYIQVFFDLQGRTNTTLDRFLWWLAREISRTLRQECGLIVDVPEQSAFREEGDPLQTLFLPGVWSLLGDKSLLLTFDEFDALDQPEIQETLARPLIDYLRRLFDHEKLSFIFSIGSSGHKLENMQAAYTNFFKSALYRKISFLAQEDCRQLIIRPVEGVLTYHPDAIDRIYQTTAGHPYFTQLMCHELFSVCQKTGRRSVDPGDVEAVLEDVIERGTVNLKFVWDEASPLEKWVLACLAQADSGASDQKLARILNYQRVRYSESDLNRALLHLREKDVLTRENGFVVSLMRLWLQKNRPLERVREELVEVNPIANRYIEIGEEYQIDVKTGATNPVFEMTFGSGCRFWIELTDPQVTGNPGYVWKVTRESGLSIGQGYADSLDPYSYNAFRMLNSEDDFAIYLRGEPLTHFWDKTCTGDENAFSVKADEGQYKLILDNLKFWDLSPAWVKDFANPALQSIANAPPDFEDDFSSQKPEWGDPLPPGVRIAGDPHHNLILNTKDNADIRVGGEHLSAEDFVLQYDISNFSLGSDTREPTHKLFFGDSVDGQGCSFGLSLDVQENGEEAAYYWDVTDHEDQIIAQGSTGIFNADPLRLNETIVIINQSGEYGIFLNEEPLVYFQEQGCAGPVSFGALAQGVLELILDNVKFWTLGPLPVEDFTGPVLHSIAELPPDFEDDFSSRRPEWETLSGVEFLTPENVMRFKACGFAWAGRGAFDAKDF